MKDLVEALERRLARERAARRDAEARLTECRQAQDRLVLQRTEEIVRARDEAVAASSAKSAFVANVSHEIRTPLTSIIGFAELLLDRRATDVDRDEAVHTIIRNGRHLLTMVNDILDLSKIETGQVDVEHVVLPLPVLLRELTELVSGKVEEQRLAFHVEPRLPLPASIRTDPLRLKQILVNFFGNAVKFTRTGAITLSLAWTPASRTLRFTVADTGIGMTPEQMARLFQPFVQADISTTRKFGGTGLGLYISSQLAGLLGARLSVDSVPGRGSAFHLDVVQAEGDTPADLLTLEGDLLDFDRPPFAITQVSVPELRGRVLLADDAVDIRRLLTAYLQQAGLAVETAADGREAIDKALRGDFDIVLMDIQMPGIDGVDATRTLRAGGFTAPIVALTANVMASDIRRYREAGCVEVLAKPIDREAFYDVLSRCLGQDVLAGGDMPPGLQVEIDLLRDEFLAGLPSQLDVLDRAQGERDWPAARSVLHVLKGSAGSYGFRRLTDLAGLAELAILAEEYVRASMLCARVLQEGRRVLRRP